MKREEMEIQGQYGSGRRRNYWEQALFPQISSSISDGPEQGHYMLFMSAVALTVAISTYLLQKRRG